MNPEESIVARLREAFPDLRELPAGDAAYRWATESNRIRAWGELESARLAEEMGYQHHVEMHLRRALEIFRGDWSARDEADGARDQL